MFELAYIAAGFFVALVLGMTGVGRGPLTAPSPIFARGVKPRLASSKDLLFAAFSKVGGIAGLTLRRLVSWRIVGLLSSGSLPAAGLTLWTLRTLGPADQAVQGFMTAALGIALALTAAATLDKAWRVQHPLKQSGYRDTSGRPDAAYTHAESVPHPALVLAFGAVIGTLVTSTSFGAGAVQVTLLAGPGDAGLGSVARPLLAYAGTKLILI